MPFGYDVLPDEFSAGSRIGPDDPATIVSYVNGFEDRLTEYTRPKVRMLYSTAQAVSEGRYAAFRAFFRAHRGASRPFLVKDWSDFSLSDENMVGTVDGSNTDFQLVKGYNRGGANEELRPIEYADTSTWSFVDGAGTPLSVSTSDGSMITFSTAPTAVGTIQPRATVPLFWILMRFANTYLPVELEETYAGGVPDIELLEVFARS